MLAAFLLPASLATSPADFVKGMSIGINLGNVLDAPHEGAWAAPAEERYFDDYVSAGFKSVRVPVRWDKHTMTSSPWTVSTSFLDRVDTVVGWALDRGLHTIVNAHHEDWLDGAATDGAFELQLDRLAAIWRQVAARFARKSDALLAFEVYNEPHANMTVDWLNRMNAAVLPVIRETNPTRNVLFGGLKWMNPAWIIANPHAMRFPNDSHVFLEVHSYDPYTFCGMSSGGITHSFAASTIDTWANGLASWAAEREMPVLLGEFGCNRTQTNHSGRVSWYRYMRETVQANGFAATVWDDSGSFAIYDRAAGTWDADVLDALGLRGADSSALAARETPAPYAEATAPGGGMPALPWRPMVGGPGAAPLGSAARHGRGLPSETARLFACLEHASAPLEERALLRCRSNAPPDAAPSQPGRADADVEAEVHVETPSPKSKCALECSLGSIGVYWACAAVCIEKSAPDSCITAGCLAATAAADVSCLTKCPKLAARAVLRE